MSIQTIFRSATDNVRNRIKKRDLPGVVVIDTPVRSTLSV